MRTLVLIVLFAYSLAGFIVTPDFTAISGVGALFWLFLLFARLSECGEVKS